MASDRTNREEAFIQFKLGNETAFEKIFNEHYAKIVGFCENYINDNDQAQSLAQEAFIKLWLNKDKINVSNGIPSFLYTSAKTGCLNYIRHKKVAGKYINAQLNEKENRLNIEILESFDFNSLEYIELEKLIKQTIEELPERCRQVFFKKRYENKKNKEIAEEMGISVKSVEANMSRALKILKSKLSEFLPEILVSVIMQYL